MSKVVTILAESKKEAYKILKANHNKYVVRVASDHKHYLYRSKPPVISNIDQHMPTNRLNEFTAKLPGNTNETFVLVAIVQD